MKELIIKQLDYATVSDCIRGWISAFPHWQYDTALKTAKEQIDNMVFLGAYKDNIYTGMAVAADVKFNFRGTLIKCLFLDHLHVEPLYRKQGISKFLVKSFQEYALKNNYCIVNVGPFNTEYYRNMGFGFGPKQMNFTSKPESFQHDISGPLKHLVYYDGSNLTQELEQYLRTQHLMSHGNFIEKEDSFLGTLSNLASKEYITLLCLEEGSICGVLSYKAAWDICIEQFFFSKPIAAKSFSTYLHRQKGHINTVKVIGTSPAILSKCNTPYDITLREENMIKIIDIDKFIQSVSNVQFLGENLTICFELFDPLTRKTTTHYISNSKGKLINDKIHSQVITINMLISDFSSLIISQIDFQSLINSGLVQIDKPEYINTINMLFSYSPLPYCL